jgi:hypothetical protein
LDAYLRVEYLASGNERAKRWLLETLVECNDLGGYSATVAAAINEANIALKCLREWPDQTAEILRECSLGAAPVLRPGCLGQRLLDNRTSGGAHQDVIAIHAVSAAAAALQGRGALTVANVHICGEGYAGNSITWEALVRIFSSSSGVLLSPSRPEIFETTGHSVGVVTARLERGAWLSGDAVRLLFHDYDGQEEYRANHAAHLAAPNSVYLLVVPLWDKPTDRKCDTPMDLEYVVGRYRRWLRFLSSVAAASARKVQCITILDFKHRFPRLQEDSKTYTLEEATARLAGEQELFGSMEFVAAPFPVSSEVDASFRDVVPLLWKTIKALQGGQVFMSTTVQAVVDCLQTPGRWPLCCNESELQSRLQATIRANLRLDPALDSDLLLKDKVIRTVAEITQDMLLSRGDITKVSWQATESLLTGPCATVDRSNWLAQHGLADALTDGATVSDVYYTSIYSRCK